MFKYNYVSINNGNCNWKQYISLESVILLLFVRHFSVGAKMIENRTKIKKNNAMYTIFVFFSHLFHISFEFGQDYKAIIVESFMLLPFFLSVLLAASRYRSVVSVFFFYWKFLSSSRSLQLAVQQPFMHFAISCCFGRRCDPTVRFRFIIWLVSISLCAFIFLSVISPPKLIAKCCATFSYFAL